MNRRVVALAACTLTATVTAPTAATVAAPAWKPAAFEGFDHVQPHRYTTICPATIAGCLGPYFHAVSGTVTDGHGQQRSPGNAWASRGVLHVVARPAEPGDGPEPYTGADVVENGDGHGTLAWDVRARYVPDPAGVTWFNVLLWRGPHARCWPVGGETNFAESQGGRWLKYFVHAARYQDPVMSCGVQNSIAWRDPVRWPAASGGGLIDASVWHVYRAERWTDRGVPTVVFKVDGRETFRLRDARIPMDRQIVSFQVDVPAGARPAGMPEVEVDWARLWVPR
jgi:hypothetical protein